MNWLWARKPRTFPYGGQWGDSISFFPEGQKGRVCGWKTPKPKRGDLLRVPMQSGRTAIFRFTNVDLTGDPADMFFADTEPVAYEEKP